MKNVQITFLLIPLLATQFLLVESIRACDGSTAVYLTAKNSYFRLAKTAELEWIDLAQTSEKENVVFVDANKTYQTILGIGGALTDAAAETFFKLPAQKQQEVMQAYFDPTLGNGYT